MKILPLLITLALLALSTAEHVFDFEGPPNKWVCFSEQATKGVMFLGVVRQLMGQPTSILRITAPDDSIIVEKSDQEEYHFAFVANQEGDVKICLKNGDKTQNNYMLSLKTGAEAQEASEPPKKIEVAPVQRYLNRIERMVESIKRNMQMNTRQSEETVESDDNISFLVKSFSVIVIICCGVLGFVQVQFFKSFFKKKKII